MNVFASSGAEGSDAVPPTSAAALGFMLLLGEDEGAYEELYAASLECLDRTWLSLGASYMQFNQVRVRHGGGTLHPRATHNWRCLHDTQVLAQVCCLASW